VWNIGMCERALNDVKRQCLRYAILLSHIWNPLKIGQACSTETPVHISVVPHDADITAVLLFGSIQYRKKQNWWIEVTYHMAWRFQKQQKNQLNCDQARIQTQDRSGFLSWNYILCIGMTTQKQ
jgi:hypothetical protein